MVGPREFRAFRPSPPNRCWKLNSIIIMWELPLTDSRSVEKLTDAAKLAIPDHLQNYNPKNPLKVEGSKRLIPFEEK